MKKLKKLGTLGLLFLGILFYSCILFVVVWGNKACTEGTRSLEHKIEFEEKGIYYTTGLGDEFYAYHFNEPNADLIVYNLNSGNTDNTWYVLGEDVGKSTAYLKERVISKEHLDDAGIRYGDVFIKGYYQFVGISDKYILFLTADGKRAVEIEEIRGDKGIFHKNYSYEELTEEEKEKFIYPTSYEIRNNQ